MRIKSDFLLGLVVGIIFTGVFATLTLDAPDPIMVDEPARIDEGKIVNSVMAGAGEVEMVEIFIHFKEE